MAKEQKLTPFKYACQVYAKDIEYCPAEKDKDYECENWDGHVKYETCADCIEHYIKKRADVPDGYEVLKKILKELHLYAQPGADCGVMLGETIKLIVESLKKAGVEVNNDKNGLTAEDGIKIGKKINEGLIKGIEDK